MANATPPHPTDVEKDHVLTDPPPSTLKSKLAKHSHDADAALQAFDSVHGQVLALTPEKNKELLRKIDWHLMPVCLPFPSLIFPSEVL
jgi:ACS family allantoate permease-like MFS transporter